MAAVKVLAACQHDASAAYQELVRAWLVLADTAEQLTKLRRVERAKPAITAKAA
jgi:hypothetical protein